MKSPEYWEFMRFFITKVIAYLSCDLSGTLNDDDSVRDIILQHGLSIVTELLHVEFVLIMEED